MTCTYACVLSIGQQTPEQLAEARKVFESVQALERQKQQLQFQLEQQTLSMKQAKAAHDMEREFQRAMKMEQSSDGASTRDNPIKLVLRKRYV